MGLKYEPASEPLYIFAQYELVVVLKLKTIPIGTAFSCRILRVIRRGTSEVLWCFGALVLWCFGASMYTYIHTYVYIYI